MTNTDTQTAGDAGTNAPTPGPASPMGGELVPMSRDELARWLSGVTLTETDSAESDYDLAMKILGAETLDQALEPDDVRKSEDLVGVPFTILSVDWHKSTKLDRGPRRYAFMRCVDGNGVKFFTSCGATHVVLMLARLIRDEALPATMTFDAIDTNTGNTMIRLAPVGEPF